jgi:dienelactone hydrolase
MKPIRVLFLLVLVNFIGVGSWPGTDRAAAASAARTQEAQPVAPTIASAVDKEISGVEKQVVDAAEAMPEEKFNFSPENLNIAGSDYKGVLTFALQVRHIAASNYAIWSPLTGDKFPTDFLGGNGPENLRSKADILKFLKDSFALGHKAAATLTTQNMLQAAENSKSTRLRLATYGVAHAYDHYGQMVEYLRMNGIVPPASRGTQAQQPAPPPVARVVDLKATDGALLKASYFAAAKPGPGVLLLHQFNRTRKSWDEVATQLAAAGINTLTLDMRGFGESGGTPHDKLTDAEKAKVRTMEPNDVDAAFQYLVSQPGVRRDVIGVGGAGAFGVDPSVEVARRHSAEVKSLALLSGETLPDGLQFLKQASQLPGLFVVADNDEYPPTVEAMELLYITSSNPGKKFVHYSASHDAPWIWYETADASKVPANGGHGTDLFKVYPELPGIIVDWFATTLIKTPGHAPADTVASAAIIDQIRTPGGDAQVTQQLRAARRKDPGAQLFPEVTVSIVGQDHMRAGEPKFAVEVLELNLLAYPESADAHETLSEAYLANGQKDLARQHAEKALALLDSHALPASTWSDTEPYRGEIRSGAQDVLKKVDGAR